MNKITVNGILSKDGREINQKHLYHLAVERKSGTVDTLLVASEDGGLLEGAVHIEGTLKSEWMRGIGMPAIIIPDTIKPGEADGKSEAAVMGYLRDDPVCRYTKNGFPVMSLVVMTEDGPIPVLLWGGNATRAKEHLRAGNTVKGAGRLQSRTYPDRKGNIHTTYELSARGLTLVED